MFYFYTPWKHQKTHSIEVKNWLNTGSANNKETIAQILVYLFCIFDALMCLNIFHKLS